MTRDKLLRPDGPWSVVVCMAAFLEQIIAGMNTCSGIYYLHFKDAFDSSATATSWLCSMAFVGIFIGTVFGGPLSRMVGDRLSCFVGGLISSIGFALCMYTPNFYLLFFFYGILGCIGIGVHYVGFIQALNKYFDKYIHTVQIFVAIGCSVGVALGSVLLPFLLRTYGWRGTLLIQGGMSLNVCAFSTVLFLKTPPSKASKAFRLSIAIKNKDILPFSVHSFLIVFSESAIYVHLPVLLESKGFDEKYSSLSILVLGISIIVARVIYTIPCKINVVMLYTLTFFVGGITCVFLPFGHSLYVIFGCTVVTGFSLSAIGGLTILVILELSGKEDFIDATVISYMFRAAGSISSGPLCGIAYDLTRDYSYAFYLAGMSIVVACVLLVPSIIRSFKRSKRHQALDETSKPMTAVDDKD